MLGIKSVLIGIFYYFNAKSLIYMRQSGIGGNIWAKVRFVFQKRSMMKAHLSGNLQQWLILLFLQEAKNQDEVDKTQRMISVTLWCWSPLWHVQPMTALYRKWAEQTLSLWFRAADDLHKEVILVSSPRLLFYWTWNSQSIGRILCNL